MNRQAIALVLLSASLPLSAETFRARATASGAMNGTSYADAWALTGANSVVWASTDTAGAVDAGDTLYVCDSQTRSSTWTPAAAGESGSKIVIDFNCPEAKGRLVSAHAGIKPLDVQQSHLRFVFRTDGVSAIKGGGSQFNQEDCVTVGSVGGTLTGIEFYDSEQWRTNKNDEDISDCSDEGIQILGLANAGYLIDGMDLVRVRNDILRIGSNSGVAANGTIQHSSFRVNGSANNNVDGIAEDSGGAIIDDIWCDKILSTSAGAACIDVQNGVSAGNPVTITSAWITRSRKGLKNVSGQDSMRASGVIMENVSVPIVSGSTANNIDIEVWNSTAYYDSNITLSLSTSTGVVWDIHNSAWWPTSLKVTGTNSTTDYGMIANPPGTSSSQFSYNLYRAIGVDTMNFRCCSSNTLREFSNWQTNCSAGADDSCDETGSATSTDFMLSVTLTDPLGATTSVTPTDPSWAYPQAGSPLRDAGTTPPAWAKDFYGRAFVAPYDIGAVDSSYGPPDPLGSAPTPDPPISKNHIGGGSPATGGIW